MLCRCCDAFNINVAFDDEDDDCGAVVSDGDVNTTEFQFMIYCV